MLRSILLEAKQGRIQEAAQKLYPLLPSLKKNDFKTNDLMIYMGSILKNENVRFPMNLFNNYYGFDVEDMNVDDDEDCVRVICILWGYVEDEYSPTPWTVYSEMQDGSAHKYENIVYDEFIDHWFP